MRNLALSGACLALLASLPPAADRPVEKPNTVILNGHTFTLPAGFTIEVAAKAPLVQRPIVADFDEQGRLYVADSSGSNAPVAQQLKSPTHRIVRLEDTDGDGVFDKRTVFADKMMFPEGAMWRDGSLYVAAPPSIWKLTDTDGDGVADRREEWFKGKTLTGCANDLHGPYNGPDGWVYWCKGAFAKQEHSRPGKEPFVTRAAHIFRCRPDGSGLEAVMTGGMDNPVDVVFTPGGERIFTTTFFQHPGGGLRDGLIHAVYGGVYGKDHGPVYEHPWTGPSLMPVLTHMGPAAPAGLAAYESRAFGAEYQNNLFAAQFNLRKVSRHVLVPTGATFTTRDSDLAVSTNHDFHPTDVIEDADGSLLIIDTGGWYKLCCPSSQLVKTDVLGAIYRVRKTGAPKVADPRGLKLDWKGAGAEAMVKRLGDARPAVQRRAIAALARQGDVKALSAALRGGSPQARRNAVWAATRIEGKAARDAVRAALADRDDSVRLAALHSTSLHRDAASLPELLKVLESQSPPHRRAAAEALGRIGDSKAVPVLLTALKGPADRAEGHSLIYALIEIADAGATRKGLASDNAGTRLGALIALDQMPKGGLKEEEVLKELSAADAALREAAWWIAGRRPGWGDALAGHFRKQMASAKGLTAAGRDELAARLARFTSTEAIRGLLAEKLGARGAGKEEQLVALRALAASRQRPASPKLIATLHTSLSGEDNELVREAVRAAQSLGASEKATPGVVRQLRALANDEKRPADLRVAAAAAVPGAGEAAGAALFAFLCQCVAKDRPLAERGPASGVLARAKLSEAQLLALADVLKSAGPLELEALLDAFARPSAEKVGLRAVAALRASPARASLHVDRLRARFAKYPAKVREQAEALIASLDADAAERKKQLDALVAEVKKGDVRRGQAVFNSQKTACASCHAIGYVGGKVGPDLTRIGQVRDERDLLESILFPSASLVRSYEPVQVTTRQGVVHNGLVKQESTEAVVLTKSATEEVRVRRADVEEMVPSKVSIMPAGLDKSLTRQELLDLVAFLRACR